MDLDADQLARARAREREADAAHPAVRVDDALTRTGPQGVHDRRVRQPRDAAVRLKEGAAGQPDADAFPADLDAILDGRGAVQRPVVAGVAREDRVPASAVDVLDDADHLG